jgi:hypothetical protein
VRFPSERAYRRKAKMLWVQAQALARNSEYRAHIERLIDMGCDISPDGSLGLRASPFGEVASLIKEICERSGLEDPILPERLAELTPEDIDERMFTGFLGYTREPCDAMALKKLKGQGEVIASLSRPLTPPTITQSRPGRRRRPSVRKVSEGQRPPRRHATIQAEQGFVSLDVPRPSATDDQEVLLLRTLSPRQRRKVFRNRLVPVTRLSQRTRLDLAPRYWQIVDLRGLERTTEEIIAALWPSEKRPRRGEKWEKDKLAQRVYNSLRAARKLIHAAYPPPPRKPPRRQRPS